MHILSSGCMGVAHELVLIVACHIPMCFESRLHSLLPARLHVASSAEATCFDRAACVIVLPGQL